METLVSRHDYRRKRTLPNISFTYRGCVTPDILEKLSRAQLERIPTFNALR